MPVHVYTNWNKRQSDLKEQIEPFRKYFFICEGANTESFYFKKLIDLRKELGIHPLIDVCFLEKTETDKNISFPSNLVKFAFEQKTVETNEFDINRDNMVVVFDADIFEEKVKGYDKLIELIEKSDIAAVTNPNFELFLLLHLKNSYENYIRGNEKEFLTKDIKNKYSYSYNLLHDITGINSKKNPNIGNLAQDVLCAISEEKKDKPGYSQL